MVRLARELRGLTQTEAANRAGSTQALLSRIESGQVVPEGVDTEQLAAVLDVPVAFLVEPGVPAAAPLFRKRAIRSARRKLVGTLLVPSAVRFSSATLSGAKTPR